MTNELNGSDLQMFMEFDEETDLFVIRYMNGTQGIFQVKMCPENFQNLTNDMIRTIKNYNLMQAQKYTEKKESQAIAGAIQIEQQNCPKEEK